MTKDRDILVSKSEAALFFQVSTRTISDWVHAGCPVAERDQHDRIKLLSLAEVFSWRLQSAVRPDTEALLNQLIRMHLLDLKWDMAEALPDFIEKCVSELRTDTAAFGAACTMSLLSVTVRKRDARWIKIP